VIGVKLITGEAIMLTFRHRSAIIALSAAAAFAFTGAPDASAAKKMSYDQAWAQCKSQIDRTIPGDQASARTSAGGACMKKYGYRLKK
jgi:hypothetical protein